MRVCRRKCNDKMAHFYKVRLVVFKELLQTQTCHIQFLQSQTCRIQRIVANSDLSYSKNFYKVRLVVFKNYCKFRLVVFNFYKVRLVVFKEQSVEMARDPRKGNPPI